MKKRFFIVAMLTLVLSSVFSMTNVNVAYADTHYSRMQQWMNYLPEPKPTQEELKHCAYLLEHCREYEFKYEGILYDGATNTPMKVYYTDNFHGYVYYKVPNGAHFSAMSWTEHRRHNLLNTTISSRNTVYNTLCIDPSKAAPYGTWDLYLMELKPVSYGGRELRRFIGGVETFPKCPRQWLQKFVHRPMDSQRMVFTNMFYFQSGVKMNFEVNKTDNNNKPLQGAEFQITITDPDTGSRYTSTMTSNEQGIAKATVDKYWIPAAGYFEYEIKEIKAPWGYAINVNPIVKTGRFNVRNRNEIAYTSDDAYVVSKPISTTVVNVSALPLQYGDLYAVKNDEVHNHN